jgi:hypothetical protein
LEAGILEVPGEEKEFETMEDAKVYAYLRQAMRRNLTQAEIFIAATSLKLKENHDGTGRAAEILGKVLGVSPATIYHARAVKENASEEMVDSLKSGDMSINKAYRQIKGKKSETEKPDLPEKEDGDDGLMETAQETIQGAEIEPVIPDAAETLETLEDKSDTVGQEPLPIAHAISAIENFLNTHRSDDLEDIGELEKALEILEGITAA